MQVRFEATRIALSWPMENSKSCLHNQSEHTHSTVVTIWYHTYSRHPSIWIPSFPNSNKLAGEQCLTLATSSQFFSREHALSKVSGQIHCTRISMCWGANQHHIDPNLKHTAAASALGLGLVGTRLGTQPGGYNNPQHHILLPFEIRVIAAPKPFGCQHPPSNR